MKKKVKIEDEIPNRKAQKIKKNMTAYLPKLKIPLENMRISMDESTMNYSGGNVRKFADSKHYAKPKMNNKTVNKMKNSGKLKIFFAGENEDDLLLSSNSKNLSGFYFKKTIESIELPNECDQKRYKMFGNFKEEEILSAQPLKNNYNDNTIKLEEVSFPLREIIKKNTRIKFRETEKNDQCFSISNNNCNCLIF